MSEQTAQNGFSGFTIGQKLLRVSISLELTLLLLAQASIITKVPCKPLDAQNPAAKPQCHTDVLQ